jgi:hypothetical protein
MATTAVVADLVEHNFGVSVPVFPMAYDLIADDGNQLHRVLVEVACEDEQEGVIVARLVQTRWTSRGAEQRVYTSAEIDWFAIYEVGSKSIFYVPIHEVECMTRITLQTRPTRNNQQTGVRLAEHYLNRPMRM